VVLWRDEEHEELTDTVWDRGTAEAEVAAIIADAEQAVLDGIWPGHPQDEEAGKTFRTFYLGSAGMIWGLARLGSSFGAAGLLEDLIAGYRAEPEFAPLAHPPSLWMGETGLLLVAAEVGSSATDPGRLRELVRENREHETWELMWGSPGTMLAAQACGLDDEYRDSAEVLWGHRDRTTGLWTQTLYGQVAEILGPAHGFAGVVHALRGYVPDDVLRTHVTTVLERTALHHDGLVNWPPSATPEANLAFKIRVQWCHGAPGIVATLGDLMPLDLTLAGAELVWRAGPLIKGPGLCHGTAGNGFTFLRMFALTGDELWLDRGRRFAMHAIAQVKGERARVGRGRYTLFTGDIGVALYLRACMSGDPAFPTIDGL
jgi:Lanthionine synthetase C-like protein